ncbi:MAG TPA: amino acid ABC transporter permease [Chroococcidiopsis sp.]
MATTVPSFSAPPAIAQIGFVAWLRKNLFNSWFNSILTVIILAVLGSGAFRLIQWSFTGAKWKVIPANLPLYFAGRFPASEYWRLWILFAIVAVLSGLSWGNLAKNTPRLFSRTFLIGVGVIALVSVLLPIPLPYRLTLLGIEAALLGSAWLGKQVASAVPAIGAWMSLGWTLAFIVGLWLLAGGLGLKSVSANDWGGMLLTIFISLISIALSFPMGVMLALGRQSKLPIIRGLSTIYIEVIRGLPLLSILFFAAVMVPLFLPSNIRLNLVLRAVIGLTLFTAAYLAETIRGGLQSIPRGQSEASRALGLSTPLTIALIVLPQALKISIPAIVGLFISLLQDTTLLLIIGLFELLGISRAILANPEFIGRYAEVYLFIGLIYWMLCYAMSWGSRKLENSLSTTR